MKRPKHKERARHATPHFNADGGCLCMCRHCLAWNPPQTADGEWRSVCICRRCTEQCPSTGRLGAYTSVMRERIREAERAIGHRYISVKVAAARWENVDGELTREFSGHTDVGMFTVPVDPGKPSTIGDIVLPASPVNPDANHPVILTLTLTESDM